MAKAGFAGSLIVQAGWRGKSMSKGMKKSAAELKAFSRQVKGLVAIAGGLAVGAGGYFSLKGIMGLVKQTSAGAEAWSKWQIALQKFKLKLADILAGPASALLEWGIGMVDKATSFLPLVESLAKILGKGIVSSVKNLSTFLSTIANVALKGIIQSITTIVTLLKTLQNLGQTTLQGVSSTVTNVVNSVPFANQLAGGLL